MNGNIPTIITPKSNQELIYSDIDDMDSDNSDGLNPNIKSYKLSEKIIKGINYIKNIKRT